MKYIISEKQLAKLIVKQSLSDDLEYDNVDDASPENDDFVIGQEVGEQDEPSISTASSSSTSSSDDNSSSPGAEDYPPYPEVPKWGEHGQTPERGTANPIGIEKWGEKGQKPAKGSANSTF